MPEKVGTAFMTFVKMRRPSDAAPIGRKMLELCTHDNIGIRFTIEDVEDAINDEDLKQRLAEVFEAQDAEDRD